jgi:hypothetical protein|tara:strand:- start:254 stop:412 length:159 start_codon:yes stop_codon:yes gene_type:complete
MEKEICQICYNPIGLFKYGHTASELFCSGKCQEENIRKQKEQLSREGRKSLY